jgi:hypothetical protein
MANEEHFAKLKEAIAAKDITIWNNWRKKNRYVKLDFSEVYLSEADLSKADLTYVDLSKAHLSGANLYHGMLGEANLQGADLGGANLSGANLNRANFSEAILSKANLSNVNLERANLSAAHLWETNLCEAFLSEANLSGAWLVRANFSGANLSQANLSQAHLFAANLSGANLSNVDFSKADLSGANLENSNVLGARFDRWARYQGIRIAACYGSPLFKKFAQDQEFIEEFRAAWWRKPAYWLWLILADCGRSLLLWTVWCAAAIFGFAYRYLAMGSDSFKHVDLPWQPASAIYYSVVTFTTLGFGDIAPKTIPAAMWVMTEVIMGYVMLGGLISIFANKLARRS